jgi:hypothetical protein
VWAIDPQGPLTEQAARQAILQVGKYKNASIVFTLPQGGAADGRWHCDLKHKRFWIDVDKPLTSESIHGVFERVGGQAWRARITQSAQFGFPPGPLGPNPNPP